MVDIMSKEKRSYLMSKIRSKNTSIELLVKKALRKEGIRFVMHPKMGGNPDFIIPEKRLAVFCDGDFWHGYDYKTRRTSLSKPWRGKIETNMKRDKRNNKNLEKDGWRVIRIWEHQIRKNTRSSIRRIMKYMK
jgi:DNA mismatch endonuclease (patch repair protein)